MDKKELAIIILNGFKNQNAHYEQYVDGNENNLNDVCLDGYFNILELAEYIGKFIPALEKA